MTSISTEPPKKWEKVVDKDFVSGDADVPLPHEIFDPSNHKQIESHHLTPDFQTNPNLRIDVSETLRDQLNDVFVLDNVLSEDVCRFLIQTTENLGYTFWDKLHTGNKDFRSAFTIEVIHQGLANYLWERMKDHVVKEIDIRPGDERWERELTGTWVADGVYPKLLFARYVDGQHFGPHTDGSVALDMNHRTLFPLTIYLNDVGEGGETVVVSEEIRSTNIYRDEQNRYTSQEEQIITKVHPKIGRVMGFYCTQMHEGKPVGKGSIKYIIRSDILYKRKIPILDSPTDKEAFKIWQEAENTAEKGDPNEASKLFRKALKLSPGLADLFGM